MFCNDDDLVQGFFQDTPGPNTSGRNVRPSPAAGAPVGRKKPRPPQRTKTFTFLLSSPLLSSPLLYSTLLYSTLLYSTLLYSTLLYSTYTITKTNRRKIS